MKMTPNSNTNLGGIMIEPDMKFDPTDGSPDPQPKEAGEYRHHHGDVAWLFNPWTGHRRDVRDIGTDVLGYLIVPPENTTTLGTEEIVREVVMGVFNKNPLKDIAVSYRQMATPYYEFSDIGNATKTNLPAQVVAYTVQFDVDMLVRVAEDWLRHNLFGEIAKIYDEQYLFVTYSEPVITLRHNDVWDIVIPLSVCGIGMRSV